MLISYEWLTEFFGVEIPIDKITNALDSLGFSVQSISTFNLDMPDFVFVKILEITPHPKADKLYCLKVSDTKTTYNIVCGAQNVSINKVSILALPGAKLPVGDKITKSKIRGVISEGMLCSPKELNFGEDSKGVVIFDSDENLAKSLNEVISKKDFVIDIEVPPNRPDCLSHLGVAREISCYLNLPLIKPQTITYTTKQEFPIHIETTDLCHRYIGKFFFEPKISISPLWMIRRLFACGMRPINNLVDITNYVLLEVGHPLHIFDYQKLSGGRIIVRSAKKNEKILCLDGNQIDLNEDDLVIADSDKPVAIAGIIGGQNTAVDFQTKNVLLESACFKPEKIKSMSKKMKLKTESSYRFERGLSCSSALYASDRAHFLISKLTSAKLLNMTDNYPTKQKERKIFVDLTEVKNILGTDFDETLIWQKLPKLDFTLEKMNNQIVISIPHFRNDIAEPIDICEEIARIIGYENIKPNLKSEIILQNVKPINKTFENEIRKLLTSIGFVDVYNYNLLSKNLLESLLPDCKDLIALENPVSLDYFYLRNSLIYGLITTLITNLHCGKETVKIFEIGNIFLKSKNKTKINEFDQNLIDETPIIGLLIFNQPNKANWLKNYDYDIFYLTGVISSLLNFLNIKFEFILQKNDFYSNFFQENTITSIKIENDTAGYLGIINNKLLNKFGLSEKISNLPIFAEIRFDILEKYSKPKTYLLPPKFPPVIRDISFIIAQTTPYAEILNTIKSLKINEIFDINLIDRFKKQEFGNNISITMRFFFRSYKTTLTDEFVNETIKKIITALEKKHQIKLRGQI